MIDFYHHFITALLALTVHNPTVLYLVIGFAIGTAIVAIREALR